MAGELQAEYATGRTLYAVLRDGNKRAYRTDTSIWETITDANRAAYAISAPETLFGGAYAGDQPAGASLATRALFYVRAGLTPAAGDLLVWEQDLRRAPTAAEIDSELSASHGSGQWDATGDLEGIAGAVWANPERTLTQPAAQVAAAAAGSDLTVLRGDDLSVSITGLGSLSGRQALWFTAKRRNSDLDLAALAQMTEADGLLILSGAVPSSALGSLTVDDETTGNVTVRLAASASGQLAPLATGVYDLQWRDGSGLVHTLSSGVFAVTADVTRAV